MKISKILPVAALGVALSIGANQQAEAYAYAYSDLEVRNGFITITGDGYISDVPASTSTTGAQISGNLPAGDVVEQTLADAAIAIAPGSTFAPPSSGPSENAFALEGSSTSKSYAWSDSQIISEQSLPSAPVTYIETHNIAEGNTNDPLLTKSGADTTSSTTVEFIVDQDGGTFQFDFEASLAMFAEITAPHDGTLAKATAELEITIYDEDGALVFEWNGGDNGANLADGVAASSSAFHFNNVSVTDPGSNINDSDGFGAFSVTSVLLSAGTYELSLINGVTQRVSTNPIPAPGSIALLGLGLVMLGTSRQKAQRKANLAA